MIVQSLTAIALSVVVILMTWAVFRTIRRPMPGALIPLLIGATVIGYGIYSEYTWEARTLEKLPPSIEVVHRVAGESVFSPWSFLIPRTDQLSLVDTAGMRRNPGFPDQVMLDLLLVRRFNPVVQVRQLVDCKSGQRADMAGEIRFDDQGAPLDLQWESLPSDHRLLQIACN